MLHEAHPPRIDFYTVARELDADPTRILFHLFPYGIVAGKYFLIGDVAGNPGGSLKVNLDPGVGTLWNDHATDDSGADLLDLWAVNRCGGDKRAAAEDAAAFLGIEGTSDQPYVKRPRPAPPPPDPRTKDFALKIWAECVPIVGTLAETYLRGRAITTPLPPTLGFHPGLRHGPTGEVLPVMVALVSNTLTGEATGVHRTFLAPDGSGKASVDQNKMMLGWCSGGVVKLSDQTDELMVGEGIETCLSAMQPTGRPAWAALSTSGLRSLCLPRSFKKITLLADGDSAGESAVREAEKRLGSAGVKTYIIRPGPGVDFNDLLRGRQPQMGVSA